MAMTAQEKEWQADSDAYALMQAQQVKDDPNRLAKAQTKLDEVAKTKADEASAARRAKTGRKSPPTSNDTGNVPSTPLQPSIRGQGTSKPSGIMGEE